MVRGCLLILLSSLAACKSDLSLLEREMLLFKAGNEERRAEDLQAEYARHKAKADELSREVLELAKQREELYARYDQTRAEIAALSARRTECGRELLAARAQVEKLRLELEAERKEHAKLTAELAEAQARSAALAEKKRGKKASG